jgi:lantibiotic modifying enzyme
LALAERAATAVSVSDGSADRIGGFIGTAGRLYALSHIAAALDQPAIVERALDIGLRRISELLAGPCASDVLHGASGSALALLAVLDYTGRQEIMPILEACLAALERDAIRMGDGLAWKCFEPEPLVGFSHGAAGIVCSMARLGRRFEVDSPNRARCERLVVGALKFERDLFDRDTNRWPDRRRGATGRDAESTAWCHGGPGIALSRLDTLGDPETPGEIAHAVEATLSVPLSSLHGLCHGAVGNLVILERVARALDNAEWASVVTAAVPALVDSIATRPRVDCAFTDAAIGLLPGLSGVGHGLLVLANPKTPLVLAFDPPVTRSINERWMAARNEHCLA